ncbi:MAG: AAA family ATPase [Proteobacteria bacterium]|nr:AAA family ATPase [Pseudomonadota bacterium]
MINKLKVINGVGRFYSYTASGDGLDFKKNTIIFANNAYGKSTITSIMKSLATGDPNLIKERKTLGREIEQHVVIKCDGGSLIFQINSWKLTGAINAPKLYIFDQEYINDNIFVTDISTDHKKRIHEIVIGEDGARLSTELNASKTKLSEANKQVSALDKDLQNKKTTSGCADYLLLGEDKKEELDSQIESLKKMISAKKDVERIVKLEKLGTLERIELIDSKNLLSTTSKTANTINTEVNEKVVNHFSYNLAVPQTAESFIRDGLGQIKSDNCPFCGQNLGSSAKTLLEAFGKYFDYSYAELLGEIAATYDLLKERNFGIERIKLSQQLEKAHKATNIWSTYLGEDFLYFPIEVNISEIFKSLNVHYSELLDEIKKKSISINYISDISGAERINEIVNELNLLITNINELCDEKNNKIDEYISAIAKSEDLDKLESQLTQSQFLMQRFTPEENAWCESYEQACTSAAEALTEFNEKNEALSKYSNDIFQKHENELNKLLRRMGTNFTIGSFHGQANRRTSTAFAEFHIIINDSPVKIAKAGQPEPCFTNTLSAGDKNALAFAFFVARLKSDQSLKDAIVVLDDPLSSLDSTRRAKTSEIINELSEVAEQIIVLTHERTFLHLLDEKLSSHSTLTIQADATNGSKLIPFDVNEDRKMDHHKRIARLNKYISEDHGLPVVSVQAEIRIALEDALRFKYFEYLASITTLGSMLDKLSELKKLENTVLERCRNLNSISSPSHHGESGKIQPLVHLERDEIIPYIEELIDILESI